MWLTSTEHWWWDQPRRVELRGVLRDDPTGPAGAQQALHAVLAVPPQEPDGPMVLIARRRDGAPWAEPVPGRPVDVAVWTLPPDALPPEGTGAVQQPGGRPAAWCTVVAGRAEAQAVFDRQQRQGHSFG